MCENWRFTGKNITHQSACDSLKKYFAAEEELREKYEVVGNLSRTANGSLTGSVKLDFETYVQRSISGRSYKRRTEGLPK